MAYFLALDAGGTKTDYVLADEIQVLARVRSGTIKRMRTDGATALSNLEGALHALTQESGVSLAGVERICIGTAGETVPLVTDFLHTAIKERVGGDLLLLGDVEIALDAAFPGEAGLLVLAGTGSNVAGRTPGGRVITVGGWGPVLADQGSGHGIGYSAVRAVALARDGERPTTLMQAVLEHWSLEDFDGLVAYANRTPAPDFSKLTPVVLRCAAEGDRVAHEVLDFQAGELAHLVRLLIRRLQAAEGATGFVPRLAFAGSVMENALPVREALIAEVRTEFPTVGVMDGVIDPIDGALWRARSGRGFDQRNAL